MNKLSILSKIKELYQSNTNIIEYLKKIDKRDFNSIEDIMISYDFQAGSYIQKYENSEMHKNIINRSTEEIANIINSLGSFESILGAGVGEATYFASLANKLENFQKKYAFDISWSRLKKANEFLYKNNIYDTQLFVANLLNIPLCDNSIDIVITNHAIEPNTNKGEDILIELYRVAKKYLILTEPDSTFANEEILDRMNKHGYFTEVYQTAKNLNYKVVDHIKAKYDQNPLNPSGITIIEKTTESFEVNKSIYCCPLTHRPMYLVNGSYFSPDSMLVYPIINSIPCLISENAIVATHFLN